MLELAEKQRNNEIAEVDKIHKLPLSSKHGLDMDGRHFGMIEIWWKVNAQSAVPATTVGNYSFHDTKHASCVVLGSS